MDRCASSGLEARVMFARCALISLVLLAAPAAAQQAARPAPSSTPAPGPVTRPASAPASTPSLATRLAAAPSLEGAWALKIDDTVILAFQFEPAATGWSGTWIRPRSFASDGALFTRVEGPPMAIRANKVQPLGEWTELTFDDPRPGAVPDVFRLRAVAGGKVEAIYVGTGFAPLVLEKLASDAKIGPWPTGKSYRRAGVTATPGASVVTFSIPVAAAPPAAAPTARPAPAGQTQGPPALEGR